MFPDSVALREAHPSAAVQAAVQQAAPRRVRQRQVLIGVLVLNDAVVSGLALWLAWYVRIGSGWLGYNSTVDLQHHVRSAGLAVVILLLVFTASRLYDCDRLLGGTEEYSSVVRASSYGLIVLVLVSFLEREEPLSRGWLITSWMSIIFLVGATRFLWRRVFLWLRQNRGWLMTRTLMVGANDHVRAITRQLTSRNAGVDIVGFVDDFLPIGTMVMDGKNVLGTPWQLHELAADYRVQMVIVFPSALMWETFQEIMEQSSTKNGFEVQLSPGFYEILTTGVEVTHKAFVPLLRVEQSRINGVDQVLKTCLDYSLGTFLFLLTLPLMVALGIALWVTGGRPIFERQESYGMGGNLFETRRFRTGLHGTTIRRLGSDLPRVTAQLPLTNSEVGCFLYRTGLDKLPQLADVLLGHMSLVGPRLLSPGQEQVVGSWLPSLLTVKPGWVGPWAVSEVATQREEVILDQYYIRNWTIWLDLQVIFQAMRRVLSARSRSNR